VLMLMPAAVLIVLLLGAIAVDSAIVYLRQRQAYNVAFDAANDAAGAASTSRSPGRRVRSSTTRTGSSTSPARRSTPPVSRTSAWSTPDPMATASS